VTTVDGLALSSVKSTQHKQAVSLMKNLTNADNDNSMNMSTKMEMSQVNKPANKVQAMQYVKINICNDFNKYA